MSKMRLAQRLLEKEQGSPLDDPQKEWVLESGDG